MNLSELRAKRAKLKGRRGGLIMELDEARSRAQATGGLGHEERADRLDRHLERVDEEIAELEGKERAEIGRRGRDSRNTESGDGASATASRSGGTARDAGMRAIESHWESGDLLRTAAERLENVIERDRTGLDARYLAAVANPDYEAAFAELLRDPSTAHLRMTAAQVEAVRTVTQVDAERSMLIGTDSAGGFGVPFALDPTIVNVSDGTLNPIRALASQATTTGHQWKGVSSEGVTASFDAEAAEVSDDTPTLAQPVIDVHMARAFIPFSIEVGMDYSGLRNELAKLLADGRDVLESTKFLSGSGTGEPSGILDGLGAGERILTAGALDVDNVYALLNAVPPRFAPRTTVLGNPAVFDAVYRLTPAGSETEPQIMPTREGPLLGRRKAEWSDMSSDLTTAGSKLLVAGDVAAGFRIVDRIGLSIELIPHLFGASRRPTGQRGVFAYWRVGSAVIAANALRFLEKSAA